MPRKPEKNEFEQLTENIEYFDPAELQAEIEGYLQKLSQKNKLHVDTKLRKNITHRFKNSNLMRKWPFLEYDTIGWNLWNLIGSEYDVSGNVKFNKSKTFLLQELNFGVKRFIESTQVTVNYLQKLKSLIHSLQNFSNSKEIASGIKVIVEEIVQFTGTDDAWHQDLIRALNWYNAYLPLENRLDPETINRLVVKAFHSWVEPEQEEIDDFCNELAKELCEVSDSDGLT